MKSIRYKLWAWGPETGEGSNIQHNVGMCAKAKRSTTNRYEIANEMLCLRLAHALKLPVPSAAILEKAGQRYFASLEYSVAAETLPPCTAADIQAILANSWLACGIIVFDSWVLNEDRTTANIQFDREAQTTYLIDHGKAFFFGNSIEAAAEYLTEVKDSLVVNHDNHCLAAEVKTLNDFADWHSRIRGIPEYFIRESIEEAVELGLPADRADFCNDFLLDRRERLKSLFIDDYQSAFPKLANPQTLFDSNPFAFEPGDFDYCI